MPKQLESPHFDAEGLLREVHAQPIGLCVSTNHPATFKRLLYAASTRSGLVVKILQSPDSATAFLLVRGDIEVNEDVEALFDKVEPPSE